MYSGNHGPQVNGLIGVRGKEGAMAYPLPPNSAVPLFDEDEDVLYIKRTDGAGFATLRVFECHERELVDETESSPITRREFDELMAKIDSLVEGKGDGKQVA